MERIKMQEFIAAFREKGEGMEFINGQAYTQKGARDMRDELAQRDKAMHGMRHGGSEWMRLYSSARGYQMVQ